MKMKRKYNFIIEQKDIAAFERVVKSLGLALDYMMLDMEHSESYGSLHYQFTILASKYELLYIKLSCNFGTYVDVEFLEEKKKKALKKQTQIEIPKETA